MDKLRAGDILVFKAGDDWVGKAIAWLTDSDVSHAAMMLDGRRMVEMGSGGICAGPVTVIDGDKALLLRLCPEKPSAPLVNAAQTYIDSKTRYDFPALVYLAGLIIYRRIRPTSKYMVITDLILRGACLALDRLIQSVVLKNPDKAMVCSQLVYQVYEDCGKEYHIEIQGGLLQDTYSHDGLDGGICLADLAYGAPGRDGISLEDAASSDMPLPDAEELAKELCAALSEQETENGMDFADAGLGSLPSLARSVLDKLEEFLEKSKSNIPINALFISPADLAYKSTNLNTIGKLDIVREK